MSLLITTQPTLTANSSILNCFLGITYLVDCPDEDVDLTFKSEEKMSYLVNDSMKKTFTLPHGGKVIAYCHSVMKVLFLKEVFLFVA